MSREEAKQNLVALGIAEPTEAQITNYLNQFHSNRTQPPNPTPTPAPNPPTPSPTPNPAPAPSNDEDMERLRQQIADLQAENAKKDIMAYATAKGLSGEQAENVINALGIDVETAKKAIDSLGQIITDRETAAATKKEQELAANASNPGGGGGDGDPDTRSNAEKLAAKYFGAKKQNDILSHYVNGGN